MRPAKPLLLVLLLWALIGGLVTFHVLPTAAWLASGLFCLLLFALLLSLSLQLVSEPRRLDCSW